MLVMHDRPRSRRYAHVDIGGLRTGRCVVDSTRHCRTCGTRLARDNTEPLCAACGRRAVATPPRQPPDFWEYEGFADAFAARHIGRVVRAYRHHPRHYRVIPQHLVGSWLGLTQAQLSRIENGPRVADLTKLTTWAEVLGIPTERCWFAASAYENHAPAGSTIMSERGTVEVGVPVVSGGNEDVRRSEFLALVGGALAGLAAPPLVHAWRDEASTAEPALDEELLVQLRVQNDGFRWRDRQEGARRLLPYTSRYARRVAEFWRTTSRSHPLRTELGQLAADACHLVAYQAFDQGDRAQAAEWYRSSAELAARSADQGMYVFAMCGVSYMHARQGRDDLAFNVLQQLGHLRLSRSERCHLCAYEAHAHAAAGSRDAARRALDAAGELAAHATSDTPSSWYGLPDGTWVDRQSAIVLARLGDARSFELLDRLGVSTPAVFRRFQVTLLSTLGLAYATNGEVEAAADVLTEALKKNRRTGSQEKTNLAIEARRALPATAGGTPQVRELDRMLRDIGGSAASVNS
jgi:transcriptional regulator with XRE-family HTH domain